MLSSPAGGPAKWKEMRGDPASCQPGYCGVRMRGEAVLESTSVSSIALLYCQEKDC